jgi:hypothetical protein
MTRYFAGMKNPFTLATAAACLCAFMSLAPSAPGQAPDAVAKLESLSKQLQLTPKQKAEILPILKTEVPKMEAIKKNSSLSGMQKMRQLRAIHNESAPQMQKILTPAQYEKLQTIRQQEIKDAIAKKRGGG